jgi:hypothetical protein
VCDDLFCTQKHERLKFSGVRAGAAESAVPSIAYQVAFAVHYALV